MTILKVVHGRHVIYVVSYTQKIEENFSLFLADVLARLNENP